MMKLCVFLLKLQNFSTSILYLYKFNGDQEEMKFIRLHFINAVELVTNFLRILLVLVVQVEYLCPVLTNTNNSGSFEILLMYFQYYQLCFELNFFVNPPQRASCHMNGKTNKSLCTIFTLPVKHKYNLIIKKNKFVHMQVLTGKRLILIP